MEFINKFKNYLLSQKNAASKATVKNYLADINHFVSWIEATYKKQFAPTEVTIQIINEFKQDKSASLSASSVDRHISSLRKFFAFLKLNGDITSSPFDLPEASLKPEEDPWHIHDFKNYLYTSKSSHLTIKNYLIDVKQFLAWAEEVLRVQDAWTVNEKDILKRIDNRLVEEYKQRLLQQNVFSATSINRKLSSLRKYLSWAGQQGHMADNSMLDQYPVANVQSNQKFEPGVIRAKEFTDAQATTQTEHLWDETIGRTHENWDKQAAEHKNIANSAQSKRTYSKIPPVRLFQKLTNAGTFAFDLLIARPIAHGFRTSQHHAWVLKGRPLFIPTAHLLTKRIKRFTPTVKNVSKELYAPLSISTKDFPWYKKIIFHARYTRPEWYRKYHQLAVVHYFNWAVLIIFSAGIGFGLYNSFFQRPNPSLAALPTAGTRVLSFQGRLTDANDNPITTPSWIRFIIYNDTSASGSARLWEEVQKVSPDQDGIFSLYLGSNGSGGTAAACNSGNPPTSPATGVCGIPQSLFAQNSALWLGVTVESTAELTPREQIATVAYAVNSETLQGLPPITQSGAGTQNVILALNSSGNLAIGGSTIFQATSGGFTLSGNTLVLNTNAGTNGGITLSPDGIGAIDVQKPLQNSTNNNNILSAKGAVEIDDLAAILATSSGQSALTIDQNGTGPIISASHSGTAEFTLDSSGNGTFNGNVTGQTIYTGGGTSYYINNTTSNLNSLTLAGSFAVSGNVASNLTPSVSDTYSLGSASKEWLNLYAQNIYSNGQLLSQVWQENQGVLSPIHTQDDLALGGTATSDAKFQVFGTTGSATLSGSLTFFGINSTNLIAARNNAGITIGDNQTGNLIFSPQGGTGTIYANGANEIVGNGSDYTIKTTSNGGLNLLSAGTGNITFGQNLGNGTVFVQPNAGGQAALIINKQTTGLAVVGDLLTASNSATTEFQVTNSGNVIGRKFTDLDNTNYFLDPAGVTNALIIAGTEGIGTTNPLSQSGLDIEKDAQGNAAQVVNQQNTIGPIFTASSSGTTRFTIQNDGTLIATKYTTNKGLLYINDTTGTLAQTAQGAANTVLHGNGTSAPTFSAVDLTADVTGTLPINKGGTNNTSVGASGAIAYSDGSKYVFTSSAGSLGNCLVSNGGGAPSWGSCGGSGGGYWTLDSTKGTIYPINSTLDLFVGGTATSSAEFAVTGIATGTPTASVSATAAGTGIALKGDGSIQSLINAPLTIGGNTTGNIILSPLNGNGNVTIKGSALQTTFSSFDLLTSTNTLNIGGTGSTTNFKSNAIDSTQSTLTLFATPTSVTLGGAATTLNLGAATGTTTVKNDLSIAGNTTLGTNTSNTVTVNGLVNSSILPSSTSNDLGSPAHYWGTVYAQNFVAPVAGGVSGFWQLTASVLSPVNSWNDLAVGGNATGSAKFQIFATPYTTDAGTGNAKTVIAGTATTSGNLTFTGTSSVVNLLNGTGLTIKGSGGGDAALATLVTISNAGDLTLNGDLAVNGGDITTTASTANIFSSNASSINIGGNSSTTNLKGNLTLGTSSSNAITFNGLVNSSILPSGGLDIGSLNNRWGSVYASNLYLPVAGGTDGYWTLASSVLSPTNNWNDLAVGGTATSSATPFQVFARAYTNDLGTVLAGTATTSGNLVFRGTPASQTPFAIDLLNGSSLSIKRSVGGDNGLSTIVTFGNDGNITDTGNLAINGSQLTSTTGTFSLLNTGVTNLSFAGAATTLSIGNSGGTATFNGALTSSGTFTANGNSVLGASSSQTINVNGRFISSLIPNAADTYNLGSVANEWDTLYVRQIVTPSNGGLAGFWQLSNGGVLSPANITNDLAIGGTATSSAVFQVFGTSGGAQPAGTASTSGNLTFNGANTPQKINLLNGTSLGIYSAKSGQGDAGLNATPTFYIANSGNVGIGTNNPGAVMEIQGAYQAPSNTNATLRLVSTDTTSVVDKGGSVAFFGQDGSGTSRDWGIIGGFKENSTAGNTNGYLGFYTRPNAGSFGERMRITSEGTVAIGTTSPLSKAGLDVEKNGLGNSIFVANQTGLGDILTASTSGTTKFVINNNGYVAIGPSLTTAQGILDVASGGPTFPSDLTLGQATGTNLVTNPSLEGGSTGWTLTTNTSIATDRAVFGGSSIKFNNSGAGVSERPSSACIAVTPSTTYTMSAFIYNALSAGNIGIEFGTYTDSGCTSAVTTTGRVNVTTTNQWVRDTSTVTVGSGVNSIKIRFDIDNSAVGTAWGDGFQVEQASTASPYFDGSFGPGYAWTGTPNNSTSIRINGAAFAYNTLNSASGIGAASRGIYPTLQLDQNGTGNIIDASASGVQQFTVTNGGNVIARKFTDLDNQIYYLDPAGLSVSASVAGSMTFTPASEHDINFLNNSDLNFQSSVGGDAGLTSRLFVQGASGNIGIGTIAPDVRLEIASKSANTEIIGSPHNAAIEIKNTNSTAFNEKAELQFSVGNNVTPNAAITAFYTDWLSGGGPAGLTGADLAFSTKTAAGLLSERMRIDKNGNVGIGITNPAAKLQVLQSVDTIDGGIRVSNSTNASSLRLWVDSSNNVRISGSGTETSNILLNGGGTGNIGIGTTAPAINLHLVTGGSTGLGATVAGRGMAITGNAAGSNRLYLENTASTTGNRVFFLDNGTTSGVFSINATSNDGSTFNTNGQNMFTVNSTGDIGFGATPTSGINLDIASNHTNNWIRIQNNTAADNWMIGNENGNSKLFFVGRASGGSSVYTKYAAINTTGVFTSTGGVQTSNPPDYAEYIPVNDASIEAGDIIVANTTQEENATYSTAPYQENILGIISTNPSFIANAQVNDQLENKNTKDQKLIALVGRVPTKVSTENGPIHIGDPLTSSSVPGVAMKATKAGPIVGKALADFDGTGATQSGQLINGTWTKVDSPCISGQPNCYNYAKALVFVNVSWYEPQSFLASTSGFITTVQNGFATVKDATGKTITQVGVYAQAMIGNLQAGIITAQSTVTNSLAITTANVSVAGQSLHDYIASVVNEVVSQNNQANGTQSNSVKTNLISPLSGDGIALRLKNSKIQIAKDASSSAVASIDNNGNATFSGQLNSQNLAVNGDATVSGTLHADRIEANSIAGLQAIVSTLSAQNITNVTNIYFATPSAAPTGPAIATGFDNSSSPSSSLLANNGFTDIASFSGYFSYVPSLKATTGLFEQGLVSLGGTSLADTSITGQLSINSRLILADTSINVLGGDLQIQPLRQGGVNFLAGAMTIDTNGNLTVNGNAVFNGNLAVNTISPLAGKDLNFKLGDPNSTNPKLNIQNASGSAVFAVNQLGDVVASGAATVGKLNLSLVQPALAVSDTEVVATGSAGTTAIKPHQKEITIDNPNVTTQSLIYITPVGTDQIPYLERQVSGKSFTVGIPIATPNAVNFNWLIVN